MCYILCKVKYMYICEFMNYTPVFHRIILSLIAHLMFLGKRLPMTHSYNTNTFVL